MKLFRRSRKADLNLSVQAIVILIFAVIMLGLGLGLINFIFGSAREKVGGALSLTELTIKPNADTQVTIASTIAIKFKGQKDEQIGFYNSKSEVLHNVVPKVTQCQTATGADVDKASLPAVAALPKESVDPGYAEGWKALITLPDTGAAGSESGGKFTGTMIPATYICNIGVFGCTGTDCKIDPTTAPIKTADFKLEVTS